MYESHDRFAWDVETLVFHDQFDILLKNSMDSLITSPLTDDIQRKLVI